MPEHNQKRGNTFIDPNTLMFVALHEIAHIMTESTGHKDEVWQNFKFLQENAVKIKIYKPVDYKSKPKQYCSIEINDNPYFDASARSVRRSIPDQTCCLGVWLKSARIQLFYDHGVAAIGTSILCCAQ